MIRKKLTAALTLSVVFASALIGGCTQASDNTDAIVAASTSSEVSSVSESEEATSSSVDQSTTDGLDENGDPVGADIQLYTFNTVPVDLVREGRESFTLPTGQVHEYEVVYVAEKGVNWVQAKALAEEAGGYLATITSKEENEFVFNLISDDKYWFHWDDSHNYVMSGPLLGGYQPIGSAEPDGNWRWVTGEPFTFTAWCQDGVPEDEDPRPSTQPNDATGNQNIIAYGEINAPVSYWGDFPHRFGSYNDSHEGQAYAFIIEYGEY